MPRFLRPLPLFGLLLGACSNPQATLTTGSTSGGSGETGTAISSGSSGTTTSTTGTTTGGQMPITVTLEQFEQINCSDGACFPGGMGTNGGAGDFWISPNGVALRLAVGDGGFAAWDFDCPPEAASQGSCCVARASAFPALGNASCSGNVQATVMDGSVETSAPGCQTVLPPNGWFATPTLIAGTTQDGIEWAATASLPDDLAYDQGPRTCPTLSISSGATLTWLPTASASSHIVVLDAHFDAGPVIRIACSSPEDAGTLSVSTLLLTYIAEATSVDVTNHNLSELVFDAGDTAIEIRAETTLSGYLYGSDQSPFGPCTVSP